MHQVDYVIKHVYCSQDADGNEPVEAIQPSSKKNENERGKDHKHSPFEYG